MRHPLRRFRSQHGLIKAENGVAGLVLGVEKSSCPRNMSYNSFRYGTRKIASEMYVLVDWMYTETLFPSVCCLKY